MRTFIENYLHFMKNCIRPPYEKLKSLKSGFIENSNFENNRDPCQNPNKKIVMQERATKIMEKLYLIVSLFTINPKKHVRC